MSDLVTQIMALPDHTNIYLHGYEDSELFCVKSCPEFEQQKRENTEAEELADHVRRNNIKGHSINADGSCNMGCC